MAISPINSSRLRLSGLASGMDTDSIVSNLMRIEQMKVDAQIKKMTKLEWYKESLNDVGKTLTSFRDKFFSTLSDDNIVSRNIYKSFDVKYDGNTQNALTITAGIDAKVGGATISRITQLAENASISSSFGVSRRSAQSYLTDDFDTKLSDLNFKDPMNLRDGRLEFEINGQSFAFNGSDSLEKMMNDINSSTAGVHMSYDRYTDKFSITAVGADGKADQNGAVVILNRGGNAFGEGGVLGIANGSYTGSVASESTVTGKGAVNPLPNHASTPLYNLDLKTPLQFVNGELSFSINDVVFSFKSTDSLQTVIDKVNSSGAGVTMEYDSVVDKFSISAKEGGGDSEVIIRNLKGNAFGAKMPKLDGKGNPIPGEFVGEDGAFGMAAGDYRNGKNAIMYMQRSSGEVEVQKNSNSFTIEGVTYKLNSTSDSAISFSLTQNVDDAVKKIKSFINEYNELIDGLNGKYSEKAFRGYEPLTDDEKAGLTDKQIEQLEERAKSGLLKNNRALYGFLSDMRAAFFSNVGGTGKSLANIGITTGKYFSTDRNKMVIDEDALRSALMENPDDVMNMFARIPETGGAEDDMGIVYKLRDSVNTYVNDTQKRDLDNVDLDLAKFERKVNEMYELFAQKEERYYARFTAMEKALAELQAQSDNMTSMLASFSK